MLASSATAYRSFEGPAQLCFVPFHERDIHSDNVVETPRRSREEWNRCELLCDQLSAGSGATGTHRDPDYRAYGRCTWRVVSGHLFQAGNSTGDGYRSISVRLLPADLEAPITRPTLHKCCAPIEIYDLSFLESLPQSDGRSISGSPVAWKGTVYNVLREAEGGDAARLSTELLRGDGYLPTVKGVTLSAVDSSASLAGSKPLLLPPREESLGDLFSFTPTKVKTGRAAIDHVSKFFPLLANAIQKDEAEGWVVCLGHSVLRSPIRRANA